MCGRFTLTVTLEELLLYYSIQDSPLTHQPRFNIAPGQMIPAVIAHEGKRRIGILKWGLVPSWSKQEQKLQFINAKAETLWEKPSFRTLIARKRCIVPADGFFEWKRSGQDKHPMRITLKSNHVFSMAALYDTWVDPEGQALHTCTIITTRPNQLMADIHDRMPVILDQSKEDIWLDRTIQDRSLLEPLLEPFASHEMTAYPVDRLVGSVKHDDERCILPLGSET